MFRVNGLFNNQIEKYKKSESGEKTPVKFQIGNNDFKSICLGDLCDRGNGTVYNAFSKSTAESIAKDLTVKIISLQA